MENKVVKAILVLILMGVYATAYAIPGRVIYTPKPSGIFYGNGTEYVAQPKGYNIEVKPRYQPITLTAGDVEKIMNLRPGPNGNGAISLGYRTAVIDVLKIMGIRRDMTLPTALSSGYYNTAQSNISDMVCFQKQTPEVYNLPKSLGYGFILDSSWNLTHTYQNYTAWNNTRLKYKRTTDNSIYTYWKDYNYSYTIWNLTENWFITKK